MAFILGCIPGRHNLQFVWRGAIFWPVQSLLLAGFNVRVGHVAQRDTVESDHHRAVFFLEADHAALPAAHVYVKVRVFHAGFEANGVAE